VKLVQILKELKEKVLLLKMSQLKLNTKNSEEEEEEVLKELVKERRYNPLPHSSLCNQETSKLNNE
jgi:hypothetical protein